MEEPAIQLHPPTYQLKPSDAEKCVAGDWVLT